MRSRARRKQAEAQPPPADVEALHATEQQIPITSGNNKGLRISKKGAATSESPALSDRSQIQQPETTEPEPPIVPVVVTPEVEVPLPEPPQAQATPPPPPPEPVPTEEEKQRAARLHLVHVHFKLMLYRFEEAKVVLYSLLSKVTDDCVIKLQETLAEIKQRISLCKTRASFVAKLCLLVQKLQN